MKKHYNLVFCGDCKYLVDGYMGSDWCGKVVNYVKTAYGIHEVYINGFNAQNKKNNCRYYKPNLFIRFKNFILRRNCKC
jgi:hypothetical protein